MAKGSRSRAAYPPLLIVIDAIFGMLLGALGPDGSRATCVSETRR